MLHPGSAIWPPEWADVAPPRAVLGRRALLTGAAAGLVLAASRAGADMGADIRDSPLSTDMTPTSFNDITTYNNFYEFGTGKSDPARHAGAMTTTPWSITVDGLVEAPRDWSLEELTEGIPLEERIYRFRCVEAWSRVVPWVGFPLASLIERLRPLPEARYVAFETLVRPEEMRGQRTRILDWPYREGLRMDEAMHPLTILATGLYRQPLPNQNGAPIRLVVPWKYGFKSIKSITRIRFTEEEPATTWNMMAPEEYGFYANVNPEVAHPRWSQANERVVGGGLFAARVPTRMFNGYADQVAHLYDGMDLTRQF
ncbi:protein-methionine-sulfoxide reductase catalytic subunit MsrP [Rhodobaculum claviforme]|uniref:Protein-methionine-sulfoxide reductase catalytic subunit MsrP n=1 Tax=Rhodobaculum claviforme TaxID=1549854 RepID=A0A934TIE5_9RHOB|nr:protein-methionine-sulfoxide reductase catalytic subunit MsrP [Rhodobaculum claviforme]MBK5926106.1 mononuclear molybdenum enzyme YedY [Rhodobaculum claviforme]